MDLATILQLIANIKQQQQPPPPPEEQMGEEDPLLSPPPPGVSTRQPSSAPSGVTNLSDGRRQAIEGGAVSGGVGLLGLLGALGRRATTGKWQDPNKKDPIFASTSSAVNSIADQSMEKLKREMADKHETDKMLLTEADKAVRELAGVDLSALKDKVPATVLNTLQEFSKNHWGNVLGGQGKQQNSTKLQQFLSFYNSVRPLIMNASQERTELEKARVKQLGIDTEMGRGLVAGRYQDVGHGVGGQPEVGPLEPPPSGVADRELAGVGAAYRGRLTRVEEPDPITGLTPSQTARDNLGSKKLEWTRFYQGQRLTFMEAAEARRSGQAVKASKLRERLLAAAFRQRQLDGTSESDIELVDRVDSYLDASGGVGERSRGGLLAPPKSLGSSRYKVEEVIPGH